MQALKTTRFFGRLALFLAVLTALIGLAHPALAGFVPSMDGATSRAEDLTTVRRTLENKLVAQRLAEMGYSGEEVRERLAALSDDELHRLAGQVDSLAPGGSVEAAIVILVLIILVLVVLRLVGKRVVIGDSY